jgi:hypothetical protein
VADNLPGRRIDREALERIIQRAAELQAQELDTGEAMSETDLLKLGADVGIDGRFLRQAMYEQSAGGAAPERGLIGRMFGPKLVFASRVVAGGKADVETQIAHWMSEGEALAIKRRLPDRTVWEQQRGFFAQMKRGFGVGGRAYHLARALEVTAAVTQLEDGYCHVELSADISMLRTGAMGAGFGAAGGLAIVGGGALPLVLGLGPAAFPLSLLAMVPLAAAVYSPVLAGRMQRNRSGHMQLALEQILDRLEHGEIKPRHRDPGPPFLRIADEIRSAITEGIEQSRKQRRLKG